MNTIDIGALTLDEAAEVMELLREKLRIGYGGKVHPGRYPKRDYEAWDWGKKNKELSAEHGVHYGYVCLLRRKLGKGRVPGGKHWPGCKDWDWSKSDTEIAREIGVGVGVVKMWRYQLGKPLHPRDSHRTYTGDVPEMEKASYKYDFTEIDWEQSDMEIAKALGCSREYVRQKRAELKKPKSYFYNRLYLRFKSLIGDREHITHPEALKLWREAGYKGLGSETFKRYCHRAGIVALRSSLHVGVSKHPWDRMNMALPGLVLSEIWGISKMVISSRRARYPAMARQQFFIRSKKWIPEAWLGTITLEREKAAAWRAEKNGTPA